MPGSVLNYSWKTWMVNVNTRAFDNTYRTYTFLNFDMYNFKS